MAPHLHFSLLSKLKSKLIIKVQICKKKCLLQLVWQSSIVWSSQMIGSKSFLMSRLRFVVAQSLEICDWHWLIVCFVSVFANTIVYCDGDVGHWHRMFLFNFSANYFLWNCEILFGKRCGSGDFQIGRAINCYCNLQIVLCSYVTWSGHGNTTLGHK